MDRGKQPRERIQGEKRPGLTLRNKPQVAGHVNSKSLQWKKKNKQKPEKWKN